MKKSIFGRIVGSAAAVCCLAMSLTGCGGTDSSSGSGSSSSDPAADNASGSGADIVLTDVKTGSYDGYDYELWKDSGDTKMTIGEGGNFSCEWENINNALFRRGKKYDCTKTYKELGDISIEYGVDYQPDGNSYLCVYGWTRDPLIEYYIVECWGSWRPPGQAQSLGTVTVDGGTYDIYRTTRYNQPSIDGNTTFDQFWSVRKNKPQADGTKIEGTISVSKHFQAWEAAGLELGKMYEVAFNVEGYQSKGKADIYKNILNISGDSYTADESLDVKISQAASGGSGAFSEDFEKDEGDWQPRGDGVSIKQTTDKSKDGSGSLKITGRTQNWHGAQIPLDSKVFRSGKEYAFKADVMQDSGKDITVQLTLQFNAGKTDYSAIASTTAKSGEWVTLENDAFQIPEGASELVLYIESPDSLADLYLDNASAGKAGASDDKKDESKADDKQEDSKADDSKTDSKADDSKADSKADSSKTDSKADSSKTDSKTDDSKTDSKKDDSSLGGDPVEVTPTVDISWIDTSKPMVAISFDDGASATKKGDPAYRIIDAVADAGFHATFFYVGNWIKTEEQVKYAYEKGMEIANHTTTHPYLSKCDEQKIREEFDKTHEKLKSIIGAEPSKVMRLPFLDYNSKVGKVLNDVALISCAIDTQDWNKATSEQIVDKIKKAAQDGSLKNSIVLCHENYAATAEAMEELMPWLKEQGWQVVTVSEMYAANGQTMMGGKVYKKIYS